MIFAWWMACLCDAYASVYYRKKPQLSVARGRGGAHADGRMHRDDDDYDVDFYTAEPVSGEPNGSGAAAPSTREQLEVRPAFAPGTAR
jgi:hypothetical protein